MPATKECNCNFAVVGKPTPGRNYDAPPEVALGVCAALFIYGIWAFTHVRPLRRPPWK